MNRYRALFPVTSEYAYMDNAAAGPPSTRVIEAVHSFLTKRSQLGSLYMDDARAMCERTRTKVATLIGASAEEIAYTKNTPDGLNIIANGLRWSRGDNVVTTDIEFPANIYPWMNLRDFGVELKFVRSQNGVVDPDDVIAAIDDRTRLVALSWVEFHGGHRNDLKKIGAVCRARDVFLCVDAIQGVGVVRCDVRAMNVDFLAFSSQKWLLAPHGVGILYVRRELIDRLRVAAAGQTSVQLGANYLDYKLECKSGALRFEPGYINQVGISGLEASIDLFNEAGTAAIEEYILGITRHLRSGLKDLGCSVLGSEADQDRAGVVSFQHSRVAARDINAELRKAKVVVSEREGFIRVSPHFYNTTEEIDQLLRVVASKTAAPAAA